MWKCIKCGEEIEPDFDVCWACGASKDGVEDPGFVPERDGVVTEQDRKSTRLNSSHIQKSRMPSSA